MTNQLLLFGIISFIVINGHIIGIDLGTTYSCVGINIITRNSLVTIIHNSYGNRVTPSLISFTDTSISVGDSAKGFLITNPQNTVYEFKRIIGQKYTRQIHDYFASFPFEVTNESNSEPLIKVNYKDAPHAYTATELTSMLLSQLKQSAEVYIGKSVSDAIITVPARFSSKQRQATVDAADSAGLNALGIVSEPIAAAIAYELDKKHTNTFIIVYDLGGNTLDVSLLLLDEGIFDIVATSGNYEVSGKMFDENVLNYFIQLFKKKSNIDITNNERAKAVLRREIENAKHVLSSMTHVRIEIVDFVDDIFFFETLTRARFEYLNRDLFKLTLRSIEDVLQDGGIKKSDVSEIVFVGGSTKIPKIMRLVKDFFNGKEPNRGIDANEVIAFGAAIIGSRIHSPIFMPFVELPMVCIGCVSLNEQSINININNNYASITYSFEFENTNNGIASELQYELGIDSGAYISEFIGEIDGGIYKGITKEKVKACIEYTKAKKDKKNAILISQNHDANTFKIQTNIKPGSVAVLNVTVEQLLMRTFGLYELSLDISNIDSNLESKSNIIPININLTNTDDIQDIEIPFGTYNVVKSTLNTKKIEAELTKQSHNALSYFIVRYSKNEKGGYNEMMIDSKRNTFLHRFGFDDEEQNILPRRVIFVLDKSGSMWGIWNQAQQAIIGAIKNLKEEFDRFGIVLFDSNVYPQTIQLANKACVNDAVSYMKDTKPGSATNLYGAINQAMEMIVEDIESAGNRNEYGINYINQIIFVTDGMANVGVTQPKDILQGIYDINSQLSEPFSIFGIGIGEDHGNNWVQYLNYPLIRQISIQNGGFDKRVKQSETKQDLEKFYKILESPQLSYIDVNYKSNEYEISKLTQNQFNTLYYGTDIVICGKFKNKNNNDQGDVRINAIITTNGNKEIKKEFGTLNTNSNNNDHNHDMDIDRIWAYLSLKHYEKLLLQNENNVDDTMRRLINENALNLALAYKLVTLWSSMIVVAEKEVDHINVEGMPDETNNLFSDIDADAEQTIYSGDDIGESTSGLLLLDVTPLSLGFEDSSGVAHRVIEKHSVIPTKKTGHFKGNQLLHIDPLENSGISGVVIKVIQGERAKAMDNIILAEYTLHGMYDETIDVEIAFEIDANGILHVVTNDDINGRKTVTISAENGRPLQEKIDQILRDAEAYAEQDAEYLELLQSVLGLMVMLEDDKSLYNLKEEDKRLLRNEIELVHEWIANHPDAEYKELVQRKQQFESVVVNIWSDFRKTNHAADADIDYEDL